MSKRLHSLLFVLAIAGTLACQAAYRAFQLPPTPELQVGTLSIPAPASLTPTLLPTPTASPSPSPTATVVTPTATETPVPTTTIPVTPSPEHLAVYQSLWETVRDNYLYPDYNGLDWDAIYAEYLPRVEAGLTQEDFYRAMEEMIFRLGDEHSVFLTPVDVNAEEAEFAGQYDYVGIGVLTTPVEGRHRVTVIVVFPDSPSEEAGIQPHDSLLAVDGQLILEDDIDRRTLLRGEEGTSVEILVQTPGEAPRLLTLTRRRITSSVPVPYELLESERGKRIGYILLATFADETIGGQVEQALRALTAGGPLDGLILDNRQNGGGINTVISETLGYFTHGRVGYYLNREGRRPFEVTGKDLNGSLQVPLVVLVGRNTASFGEIFAGILQDIGRAQIVGEQTDGNVEILWSFSFEDGSRVWLAHDTFRPLNNPDQDWEQTGILPDRVASSEWDQFTLETDPVVKIARELLEN